MPSRPSLARRPVVYHTCDDVLVPAQIIQHTVLIPFHKSGECLFEGREGGRRQVTSMNPSAAAWGTHIVTPPDLPFLRQRVHIVRISRRAPVPVKIAVLDINLFPGLFAI